MLDLGSGLRLGMVALVTDVSWDVGLGMVALVTDVSWDGGFVLGLMALVTDVSWDVALVVVKSLACCTPRLSPSQLLLPSPILAWDLMALGFDGLGI